MKSIKIKLQSQLLKGIILVFGVLSIFTGCNAGKINTGIISYVVIPEAKDTSMNPLLTGFLLSMKYDLASDGKKSIVYSENMQGKLRKFMEKGKEGQIWYADDSYGKFRVEVSKLNLENILSKNKNGYKEDKTKTKEILGYKCHLVTLSVGVKDDLQKLELYVTDKIDMGFKQPIGFNLDIPGLNATILEARFIPEKVSAKNIGLTLIAKNYIKSAPKELFDYPADKDFESVSFETYTGIN